ncbi:pyridoxal-phosphate dependent enzyme [Phenylobacterium sp. LjRoot225]|uniref:pyridoxal-phosphate dependent enzyme n=1 Tax=Phenylobacterium sp. LjRoot225 TaxID=3342285 RepID=UPI003ECD8BF9
MKYASILQTIGGTPTVELSRLAPTGRRLFGKVEAFNPMGSVKDRLSLAAIERAEREGLLRPGQTVVEATSGNTGIGLAMVCAAKGYPLVIVMAESFSVERRRLMRFLGAKVVLTPASMKGSGMYLKALELAAANGWFLVRQFENEANADVHSETTAQEILEDFRGERLDYWVTSFGTGGTLKGVARALRRSRPETRIVVVEADNARLLGGGVAQPPQTGAAPASHPLFQPHPIQGTTPDFISKLTADAVAEGLIDMIVPINGGDAMTMSRRLAQTEGVFAGVSSGAALVGGLKVAAEAPSGSTILCMFPDTGERYLSTPLFADVPTDMTAEELAISRSTPSARFDGAGAPPAAVAAVPPAADSEVERRVAEVIAGEPVVLFALEWCEFCWSVRRFFDALEIPYHVVALDALALQADELGLRMRRALTGRTGSPTIPQVFVGGKFVGGCTDVFDAYMQGRLQVLLNASGIFLRQDARLAPEELLPAWLHPRAPAPA